MSKNDPNFEGRFDRLEAQQEKILAALTKLESRLDIVHQELQRTSTSVYRLGLAQEAAKASRQRQERLLEDIKSGGAG